MFWVQNQGTPGDGSDAANWYNLATNPSVVRPVSGTVAIPGLPAGSYEADVWDTSSGQFASSLFLTTSGGVLTVPVSDLGADAAVKIFPAAAARMALHLTASQTVVTSGGKITFTLTYTNQGHRRRPWASTCPGRSRTTRSSSPPAAAAPMTPPRTRSPGGIGTVPAGASGSVTLTVIAQ